MELPTWLLSKSFWISAAVVFGVLLLGVVSCSIYKAGGNGVKATQAVDQLKQNNKVNGKYARVLKTVPNDNDTAAVGVFLLQHTSGGQ